MINEIRNTVLSLLNKNNNGYLTPEEFNLFANQAQLEVYESYFYDLNSWITKKNMRQSHSGSADITRQLEEVIDTFTQYVELDIIPGSEQTFDLPDDWYTTVDVERREKCEGPPTTTIERTAERVSEYKIRELLRSNLTAPTPTFPAYIFSPQGFPFTEGTGTAAYGNLGNQITLYPGETCDGSVIKCNLTYLRYPLKPKWTYSSIGPDGDPIFNPSALDYQDFELPLSDAIDITIKICEYAGLSIREKEVIQFEALQEQQQQQEES